LSTESDRNDKNVSGFEKTS